MTTFNIFQERDIMRALELLNGHAIFYGPETTGGGNLPGPFYYYLLTPPLFLGLGWIGVWGWMVLLLGTGGVIGWNYLASRLNKMSAFLWLVLYSIAHLTTLTSLTFFNPSFAPLFIIIINVFTFQAFTAEVQDKRNRSFIAACFVAGLAIQLHYSIIVCFFSLVFLKLFAKRLRLQAPDLNGFLFGLGSFGLTFLPFLIWKIVTYFGIELGQQEWVGGDIKNALPSMFGHFWNALSFSSVDFLLSVFKKLFLAVPFVTLLLVLLVRSKKGAANEAYSNDLKVATVCMFFAFLPYALYFFVPQGNRYGAPFVATISFVTVILFHKLAFTGLNLRFFNRGGLLLLALGCATLYINQWLELNLETTRVIIVFLLLIAAALIFKLQNRKISSDAILCFIVCGSFFLVQSVFQNITSRELYSGFVFPNYWQWQKIITKIYNQTNWTYEEMSKRVYYINHHIEQAPKLAYPSFAVKIPKSAEISAIEPDGYIVSVTKSLDKKDLGWIAKQTIHRDIRDGLLNGDIVLGKYDNFSSILIAPYFVKNKGALPPFFSNLGLGYSRLAEEDLFRSLNFSVGAAKTANNQYIFKWNLCSNENYYCDTGVISEVKKQPGNLYEFRLKIVGMSLSQSSKWISPGGTVAWIKPYLEVICNGKASKYQLVSSIGYDFKYMPPIGQFKNRSANNSILAPLQRNITIDCKEGLTQFSVGREEAIVSRASGYKTLPPSKLSINF